MIEGSVYEKHTTNGFRCYLFIHEFSPDKKDLIYMNFRESLRALRTWINIRKKNVNFDLQSLNVSRSLKTR